MEPDIKRHLRVISRHLRTAARNGDVEWRRPLEVVAEHLRRRIDLVCQVDVDAVARVRTQDERLDWNAGLKHAVTVEILRAYKHHAQQRADVARRRHPTIKDELARKLRLA